MRTLPSVLLVSLAVLGAPLAGARADSLRDRVELALSSHERLPDRQQLLRMAPDVDRVLREIIEQPSRRALARARALLLLGQFPSAASERTLRQVIRARASASGGLPALELQQALAGYVAVAGKASLEVLRPFLAHAQVDVRRAAVGLVGQLRTPRALQLLQARRAVESSPMVRVRIERELARFAR